MRAALAALVELFTGCSSLKPYPSVAPENVVVKSAIESGSVLSSMRGSVHIHELDSGCHASYVGTVKLDRPSIALGLPAERASFSASSSTTSTKISTLRPTLAGSRMAEKPRM